MKKIFNILKFFLSLLLLIFAVLGAITSAFATYFFSPWSPSKRKDFERIKTALNIQKKDTVYDLGCGDGRMCQFLAFSTNAKKIIGVELSFFYYIIARLRIIFSKPKNVVIKWRNFFNQDLHDANKVFLYLTSKTSQKLSEKLTHELKKNTVVVSYHFPIFGWNISAVDKPRKGDIPIYIYKIDSGLKSFSFLAK